MLFGRDTHTIASRLPTPPIDALAPATLATATFGVG